MEDKEIVQVIKQAFIAFCDEQIRRWLAGEWGDGRERGYERWIEIKTRGIKTIEEIMTDESSTTN